MCKKIKMSSTHGICKSGNGTIKLMCDKCYDITEMNINREDAEYYYGKCSNCNEGRKFHIDENMIDIIIDLNKKGYKTQFCCEGHEDDSLCLHTYIILEGHIDFPYIPKNFKIEFENKFFGKRTYITGELHYTEDGKITEGIINIRGKIKENNLKEMRKIVDNLPDRSIVNNRINKGGYNYDKTNVYKLL